MIDRVLHELGGLLNYASIPFSEDLVPPKTMSDLLCNLRRGSITGSTAKKLLTMVFDGDTRSIEAIISDEHLTYQSLSQDEYTQMARTLIDENQDKAKQIQQKKQLGKLQFFIGQMMRRGQGKVEAAQCESILRSLLDLK